MPAADPALPPTLDPALWPTDPGAARALQEALRHRIVTDDDFAPPRFVAGTDVGFDGDGNTRAAVVVLAFPSLAPVDHALVSQPTRFPYVPGLLSFREVPALLEALAALRVRPDMLLCDGQGIAHPRRIGLASHLGLLADLPAIGVAKSRLIGRHAEPPAQRGGWVPLTDGDDTIGAVLRTRAGVRPVYVSSGHRVSLASAVQIVMACTPRFRLPETTRRAHALASHGKRPAG